MCDKRKQPLPCGQLNTQESTALQFATSYTTKESWEESVSLLTARQTSLMLDLPPRVKLGGTNLVTNNQSSNTPLWFYSSFYQRMLKRHIITNFSELVRRWVSPQEWASNI